MILLKIDKKWNEVLDWGTADEILDSLYDQIALFLTAMKEMMDQD